MQGKLIFQHCGHLLVLSLPPAVTTMTVPRSSETSGHHGNAKGFTFTSLKSVGLNGQLQ